MMLESSAIMFVFAALLAFITIRLLNPLAHSLGLLDKPNSRKLHTLHTPLTGGIAIYLAVAAVQLFLGDQVAWAACGTIGLIVITGVADDRFDVSWRIRMLIQAAVMLIMVYGCSVCVEHIGSIL